MKNIDLFLFLLGLFGLTACEQTNTLETIDELTVEAFLHAGQSLDTVKFAKVIPLDSLEAEAPPDDLLPVVTPEGDKTYPLYYLGQEGYYGNANLMIEVDKVYVLEVSYQGKTITAETYIPAPPENLWLSDTLIEKEKIREFQDLINQTRNDPIELEWEGEEGAYYFVNVKNIEEDPEVINELFSEEEGGFRRPDLLTEPSTNHFYTIDAFRDLTHYGIYRVTVFRVNPEYLALYEDNTGGSGSLNEIRTNVQNGFGIFTGVNSKELYFEVVKP